MSDPISKFLSERIAAGDFPSAVYLVAEKGEIVLHEALGHAVVEPELIKARKDTIYDLASLTKVLVTGLLAAHLAEIGEIDLDDRVAKSLEEFRTDEKVEITIRNLLAHSSGFRNWLPFYLIADLKSEISNKIASEPLANKIGAAAVYSDLNFITLGKIIEVSTKESLNKTWRHFSELIGTTETFFQPSPGISRTRIAASEKGNAFEQQTCVELGFLDKAGKTTDAIAPGSDSFRSDVIWGDVHDGNAYFMGGVAGHAGLFSNAEEVFKIALQFLPNYTQLLKPETCDLFRTNFTPGMNEHRSFAFQLASTPDSTAGNNMSPESFGHLGFTGTSLWIDPVKERVFILLTNRTHNHSLPFVNINSVRREFHDLAIDFLDKK